AKKGVEDNSFRTLTNEADTPVRIDYYRMMRKWRTDLFRYGLRMTYDIALPTPGVRLWARWQHIAELDKLINTPMTFTLRPEDLNDLSWQPEADKVGASAPPPPSPEINVSVTGTIDWLDANAAAISRFGRLDFGVPDGYWLEAAKATAT